MFNRLALSLALLSGFGAPAWATVKYRIDGSGEVAVLNGQVPVGTVSGTVLVHVFSDSPSTESIGALTVTGTLSGSGELRVLVADASETFPLDLITTQDPGCVDFGGITIADTDLRAVTRLVASAGNDVTGPITVGQVFRVHARGDIASAGDITATAADGLAGFKSIESVVCSNHLDGDVTSELGSIRKVVIGVNNTAGSRIDGDIKAENGRIGTIQSFGPIGVNRRVSIRAGNTIEEILSPGNGFTRGYTPAPRWGEHEDPWL